MYMLCGCPHATTPQPTPHGRTTALFSRMYSLGLGCRSIALLLNLLDPRLLSHKLNRPKLVGRSHLIPLECSGDCLFSKVGFCPLTDKKKQTLRSLREGCPGEPTTLPPPVLAKK